MSPKITIDTKEAMSLKPIPEDMYRARVAGFKKIKKGPNATYIPAICEITEGEFEGRKFTTNLPIEGAGAGIFITFVNNVLGTDHDVDDIDELDIDTDDLVGGELMINIKNEEYPEGSGEERSNIAGTARVK